MPPPRVEAVASWLSSPEIFLPVLLSCGGVLQAPIGKKSSVSSASSSRMLFATSEAIWNCLSRALVAVGLSGLFRNKFWFSMASNSSSVARVCSFRSSAWRNWLKISSVVRLEPLHYYREALGDEVMFGFLAFASFVRSISVFSRVVKAVILCKI